MTSTLDNTFSVLVADLLRNELLNRSPQNTIRQNNQTNSTHTNRDVILDAMTQYNNVIGQYNRNIGILFGLLTDEITSNQNTNNSVNNTASPTQLDRVEPLHEDSDYTNINEPVDISGNNMHQEQDIPNTSVTESQYSRLFGLSNFSRLLRRPLNTTNVYRDYMLYVNTAPIRSRERGDGLTQEELETFTTEIIYNDISYNMVTSQCPISFDEFTNGETILQIQHCGHIFKPNELRIWLTTHHNCPVCRYNLRGNLNYSSYTFDDGDYESDDLPDLI